MRYKDISDDYYVNVNLNTEMDLPSSRDSVLYFFEQLKKHYPTMQNFYSRERGEFVLEEEKDRGFYRWAAVEPRRICSGYVNPTSIDDAIKQHVTVLESLPYTLSVSPLDCESLNFMMGFDFTYRGNHNQLLAEAIGVNPAFEKVLSFPSAKLVGYEPAIQFSLDTDCRVQCRISIETRSSAYHVRTGEYPEEQLSVYMTLRRYGSLDPNETYVSTIRQLQEACLEIADNYLVDDILRPLQQTIAIQ